MTQAVLVGGLFIGVLSALPIVNIANCCCLWVMGGGAIAVAIARQESALPIGLVAGARLGFRAGFFGAVVWLVTSTVVDAVMAPLQQRIADVMLQNATDMPVNVRGWLEGFGDRNTPVRLILGFFLQLCVATPFAALGGLLGAAFFGGDASVMPAEP